VVAEVAQGGKLGVDALGGVWIGALPDNVLRLDLFDAELRPRGTAVAVVPPHGAIQTITDVGGGMVRVGTSTPDAGGSVTAVSFTRDGAFLSQFTVPGARIAFDGEQAVVARTDNSAVEITRYALDGSLVATTRFPGRATVTALVIAPDHAVVFGGDFLEEIDFGGGPLVFEEHDTGPNNGYVVKLTPGGAHVFSRRTDFTFVAGIAVNAERVAVSSTFITQFVLHRLSVYDASGAAIQLPYRLPINENWRGLGVAMSDTGRIWWNFVADWPFVSQVPTPFLFAIAP
jgi:hypothetical protein